MIFICKLRLKDIICACSYCESLDIFAEQVIHHLLRQQRLQLVDVTLGLELRVTHHLHTEANTRRNQNPIRLCLSPTSSVCLCWKMEANIIAYLKRLYCNS